MYEKINTVRKREEGKKKEGREGGRKKKEREGKEKEREEGRKKERREDQLVVENQIYTKAKERLYLFHSLIVYDLNFLPNREKRKFIYQKNYSGVALA